MDTFLHFQATVNNAAVNMGAQTSRQAPAFHSFGYIPRREIMEHTEILFLSFGGTTVTLSTVAAPFYIPINAQVSQRPHVLANIGCFLGSSHIHRCEVTPLLLSVAPSCLGSQSVDVCDLTVS